MIFLAGPISNAPLWQDEAINIIRKIDKNIYIASPHKRDNNISESDVIFNKQLEWERHYLEIASKRGAILFWLPVARQHDCNMTYARDTRGELGEWRGRMAYDEDINVVIGGEEKFDGIDIIKRNFLAIMPNMKFYSTLEETCMQALKTANEKLR